MISLMGKNGFWSSSPPKQSTLPHCPYDAFLQADEKLMQESILFPPIHALSCMTSLDLPDQSQAPMEGHSLGHLSLLSIETSHGGIVLAPIFFQ
jgi:uncharacterized Zn-finger protein